MNSETVPSAPPLKSFRKLLGNHGFETWLLELTRLPVRGSYGRPSPPCSQAHSPSDGGKGICWLATELGVRGTVFSFPTSLWLVPLLGMKWLVGLGFAPGVPRQARDDMDEFLLR